MAKQITVCPVADLPPGAVTGAGPYAIGNIDGKYFAVTRRCRHLRADLAGGSIEDGRLVCPWHQSAYGHHRGYRRCSSRIEAIQASSGQLRPRAARRGAGLIVPGRPVSCGNESSSRIRSGRRVGSLAHSCGV
jgi:nitrite reductase/ring-hydroxylating ferredoxin subunit